MATSETTLLTARPSRVIVMKYYLVAILLVLVTFALWFFNTLLPALGFLPRATLTWALTGLFAFIAFVLVVVAEFKRLGTKYTVTDFRVIRNDGILRRSENAMPYTKVERIHLVQGVLQRILGIGDVIVDTGEDQIRIASVRDPRNVERTIMGRIQRTR